MPQRQGWAGAAHGLAESGQDAMMQVFGRQFQEQQQQRSAWQAMLKDLTDKVSADLIDPSVAEETMKTLGRPVPAGYFDRLRPSVADRMSKAMAPTMNATGPENLPSPGEQNLRLKAKDVNPMANPSGNTEVEFSPQGLPQQPRMFSTPGSFDETNPEATSIYNAVQQRIMGNLKPTESAVGVQGEGPEQQPTRTVSQFNAIPGTPNAGRFINPIVQPTGPTARQAGRGKAEEQLAEIIGGNTQGLPELKGSAFSRQEAAERGAKVETSRQTTVATETAAMPFKKAMATFANDLAQGNKQLTTINDPKTGEEQLMLVDKRGAMIPVDMPEGMQGGKARQIPATIADNVAGLSTAEIEGVKILRALRTSGLSESNDPFDPRFQKLLVNTLKVAPQDLVKGDVQQRVGFVNATLTRALMGSRPSQYVAKEIIQPHLPKQEMTGLQLTRVLTNVLQQASERRTEFAHSLGVPVERFMPTTGSYADYLKEFGVDTAAPAQMRINPKTGKLEPVQQQQ